MIFTSTRVVKMERIFTNIHGFLWFLLTNSMEKKDPSLGGGRSDFKMAGEATNFGPLLKLLGQHIDLDAPTRGNGGLVT